MGTKADFYVEKYDRLMWIGSLFKNGDPISIPTDILIQVNPVTYEEMVIDLLESKNSAIRSNGDKWPWLWGDSRMTDFTYIFAANQVMGFESYGGKLFDPVKIVQGEDLKTASHPFDIIFPTMRKQAKLAAEELLRRYGHKSAETI